MKIKCVCSSGGTIGPLSQLLKMSNLLISIYFSLGIFTVTRNFLSKVNNQISNGQLPFTLYTEATQAMSFHPKDLFWHSRSVS